MHIWTHHQKLLSEVSGDVLQWSLSLPCVIAVMFWHFLSKGHKVSVSLDDGEGLMLCEQCLYSYEQHSLTCYLLWKFHRYGKAFFRSWLLHFRLCDDRYWVPLCLCNWSMHRGFQAMVAKQTNKLFCHCMQHHLILSSFGWLVNIPHNIPKEGNKDFYSTKWGLLSKREVSTWKFKKSSFPLRQITSPKNMFHFPDTKTRPEGGSIPSGDFEK